MSAIRPRHLVVLALALAGVIAGCSGNGSPTPPAATSRPGSSAPATSSTGPTTSTTPSLRQQILAAYDSSWHVY